MEMKHAGDIEPQSEQDTNAETNANQDNPMTNTGAIPKRKKHSAQGQTNGVPATLSDRRARATYAESTLVGQTVQSTPNDVPGPVDGMQVPIPGSKATDSSGSRFPEPSASTPVSNLDNPMTNTGAIPKRKKHSAQGQTNGVPATLSDRRARATYAESTLVGQTVQSTPNDVPGPVDGMQVPIPGSKATDSSGSRFPEPSASTPVSNLDNPMTNTGAIPKKKKHSAQGQTTGVRATLSDRRAESTLLGQTVQSTPNDVPGPVDGMQVPIPGSKATDSSGSRSPDPSASTPVSNLGTELCCRWIYGLILFTPIKWQHHSKTLCISVLHLAFFAIYCVKLGTLTQTILSTGQCNNDLFKVINDGHYALRHTLLKGWDASYETPPYPPSTGDFAVYSIEDLQKGINYAVEQYYNIEERATGIYKRQPGDNITIHMDYFLWGKEKNSSINFTSLQFTPYYGLSNHSTTIPVRYNIVEEIRHRLHKDIFHTILAANITMNVHSIRTNNVNNNARCLTIQANVSFVDKNNNGQFNVNLHTQTVPIHCNEMDVNIKDAPECDGYNKDVSKTAVVLFYLTVCLDGVKIVGGVLLFVKIGYLSKQGSLDKSTTHIGIGCLLSWITSMRFIKISRKFGLLFDTVWAAKWEIAAFMICVIVLFVGYWTCSYIVLGTYNIKFESKWKAADTLFSLVQGDELFSTFAILEIYNAGNAYMIKLFSRFLMYSYVLLFIFLIFNLLIALFNSAYEKVKSSDANYYIRLNDSDRDFMQLVNNTEGMRQSLNSLVMKNSVILSNNFIQRYNTSTNEIKDYLSDFDLLNGKKITRCRCKIVFVWLDKFCCCHCGQTADETTPLLPTDDTTSIKVIVRII